MIDWISQLSDGNKIALSAVVVTAVVTVGGLFVKIADLYISWRKNKNTIHINIQSDAFFNLLQEQKPEIKSFQAEEESIKKQLKNLLRSQNKEKKKAVNALENGDITTAVDILRRLDKKQPQLLEKQKGQIGERKLEFSAPNFEKRKSQTIEKKQGLVAQYIEKQKAQVIKTKLELAALLTFRNSDESKRLLEQTISIAPMHFQALNQYGLLLLRMDNIEQAISTFEKMQKYALEKSQEQGVALGNLGLAYIVLGKMEKAIEYYQQALVISRKIKDRQGECSDLGNLGSAYAVLDQVEKAIVYYQQALVISREIKDREGEGSNLGNLGTAYARLGHLEKARGYFQNALQIFLEIGSPSTEEMQQSLDQLLINK